MDDAETILKGMLNEHVKMVKTFKGVQGVIPERHEEAKIVKHCALSLVGTEIEKIVLFIDR